MKILTVFSKKLFRPYHENKRQNIQLSIEKKITSAKRLQTMLDLKIYSRWKKNFLTEITKADRHYSESFYFIKIPYVFLSVVMFSVKKVLFPVKTIVFQKRSRVRQMIHEKEKL